MGGNHRPEDTNGQRRMDPEKSRNMSRDEEGREISCPLFLLFLRAEIGNCLWEATDEVLGGWSANRKLMTPTKAF